MANATAKSNNAPQNEVSVQDLSEQVHILKDDIATLTQSLGAYTKGQGTKVAETARSLAYDTAALGAKKAATAQMRTEDFIRTQPVVALGLAAGVGLLVGMMTARR